MSDDERLRLTYLLLGKDEPDTERDKMILSQTVARAADEITRLRAQRDKLLAAGKNYKSEYENPSPDYVLRRRLREKLFEAIAEMEGEP